MNASMHFVAQHMDGNQKILVMVSHLCVPVFQSGSKIEGCHRQKILRECCAEKKFSLDKRLSLI